MPFNKSLLGSWLIPFELGFRLKICMSAVFPHNLCNGNYFLSFCELFQILPNKWENKQTQLWEIVVKILQFFIYSKPFWLCQEQEDPDLSHRKGICFHSWLDGSTSPGNPMCLSHPLCQTSRAPKRKEERGRGSRWADLGKCWRCKREIIIIREKSILTWKLY